MAKVFEGIFILTIYPIHPDNYYLIIHNDRTSKLNIKDSNIALS